MSGDVLRPPRAPLPCRRPSWAVYPDVFETLAALEARGLDLAIVSNWDSHLPTLLEALDLAPRFRAVAVSAIEETGKPDAEIFRRVCARLGLPAARMPPRRRLAAARTTTARAARACTPCCSTARESTPTSRTASCRSDRDPGPC